MVDQSNDEKREIEFYETNIFRVHRSSLDDDDRIPHIAGSGEGMFFGLLEDLFWILIPEMRPILKELIVDELDSAILQARVVWRVSPYELCSELFHKILKPSLEHTSTEIEPARRSCTILSYIVRLYSVVDGSCQDAISIRIFEWLVLEPYKTQIAAVDSKLLDAIDALERARLEER